MGVTQQNGDNFSWKITDYPFSPEIIFVEFEEVVGTLFASAVQFIFLCLIFGTWHVLNFPTK